MPGQEDSKIKAEEIAEESIKDSRENTCPNHSHIINPNISPNNLHSSPPAPSPQTHPRLFPHPKCLSLMLGISERNSA